MAQPHLAWTALLPISLLHAAPTLLNTPAGCVAFSPDHGAITAVTLPDHTESVWHSGESGLWSARLADGSTLDASCFHITNALRSFACAPGPGQDEWTFTYRAPEITVRVSARPQPDGIELTADATPATQALLRLDLP